MTALRAFVELNEAQTRIAVYFRYSPEAVAAIKEVPGRRFAEGPPKHWTIPLSLTAAKRLREEFGEGLELGDGVKNWAREEVRRQRNLSSLSRADDADLSALLSDGEAAWLRPYQRADVAMMAATNVLNANQPGVGKTVEVIYAVKALKRGGLNVVVAPITLHKDPWRDELRAHDADAQVFYGETPAERRKAMGEALEYAAAHQDERVWLIVNPDMIRAQSDKNKDDAEFKGRHYLSADHKGVRYYAKPEVENLFKYELLSLTLDEFHKHGLGEDRNTLYARAAIALGKKALRRYALSGTPMGGKPIRLWGCLHFIEPDLYSSKWRWAEEWLEIDDDGMGKTIGGLLPGREAAFYEAHAKHMVRRTRLDALPGLPGKNVINVRVPMTKTQRKVYDSFAAAAEVAVSGGRISANGILAEFARLKQFANARCEVVDGEVRPTRDSGKLPVLIERLDDHGVRTDNPEPGARAIVASESKRMVEMVAGALADEGLAVKLLTGEVTGAKRDAVIDWYKEDVAEARTLVMTTQTGGVGLNLGMTDVIFILDETWNPDDQEQLEDRGMRNRTTPLAVVYLRTEDSIQEYIEEITLGKAVNNKNVVDLKSKLLPKLKAA